MLSVVTTLYRSAPHIQEFYERASAVAKKLAGEDYEIIFVNDGSPDNSLKVVTTFTETDNHVMVVDLSRNFGHHKAMMTGLMYSTGENVFLIDSDLEEEPEWLLLFDEFLVKEKCDVVYGVQEKRKGNWFERTSGKAFYKVFNAMTKLDLPENLVTARLMTRRYVDSLLLHTEREIVIAGLWHITGFVQKAYTVKKHSSSATTYSLSKKIAILVNSITSFSDTPLVLIFYIGIFISLFSLSYALYVILMWSFFSTPVGGWTSLVTSVWLLGGLIISFLGIIGIYLAKIFSETKRRPYTIIRQIYKRK